MDVSAIARGRTLAACEPLAGFGPVMARLRRGERAAMAELEFAEALVRCGFSPVLEPQLGSKTLDCLVRMGSKRVYAEVISPEQAAATKDAVDTLQRMATELVERTTGTRTEILLSEEPGARFDAILDAVAATLPDGRVHDVESIAKVRRDFLGLLPPNVGPLITDLDPRPRIGVASARVGGGAVSTSATIRLTITGERAHRLLSKELPHFSRTERNILAIRVTEVEGRMSWWVPLVLFLPGRAHDALNRLLRVMPLSTRALMGVLVGWVKRHGQDGYLCIDDCVVEKAFAKKLPWASYGPTRLPRSARSTGCT
jgi:hypothetical protein